MSLHDALLVLLERYRRRQADAEAAGDDEAADRWRKYNATLRKQKRRRKKPAKKKR